MKAIFLKIINLLTPMELKRSVIILGFMFVGMLLEMLGISLVVPVIALLIQDDPASRYPVIQPVLDMFGNPSQHELIVGVMLILIGIYLIKSLFLRGVMHAVMALQGTNTIRIAAHRLSTVEGCDRLYRLEQGSIVAEGSPETMLNQQ